MFSMVFETKLMDIIGKTNNSHELWCFEVSKPSEAIVPDTMEIMEIIDFYQ